jgi:hypothetical protein
MRRFARAATIALVAAGAGRASAEPATGTIVRIDGVDLVVDLGTPAAHEGLDLAVYRTLEVRHPVTHRVLRDRYEIGRVRIVRAGETLSVARIVGTPSRDVEVGDEIGPVAPATERPAAAAPSPPPIVSPAPCPDCPSCPQDYATSELLLAWRATLGQRPDRRAQIYEAYLRRNPGSRYAPALRMEIDSLRLGTARPQPTPEVSRAQALVAGLRGGILHRAREGRPVEIAVATVGERPAAFVLHARRSGRLGYRSIPMPIDRGGRARATLPAPVVHAPSFEYFVEAIPSDGRPVAVLASDASPEVVDVETPARAVERHRSRVRIASEYVSFDRLSGRDWYMLHEGDFLYRTGLPGLDGVRIGSGVYRGAGGTVDALDAAHAAPETSGFTYGYLEPDLGFSPHFAILPRAEVGLGRPIEHENQANGLRGGFQLRVRMGREEGTHLDVAGETVADLGQRAYLGLAWNTIPRWPMAAEVHVTDQPVDTDELGVRLVYELGYEPVDFFSVAGRFSYQGRTIDHAGFGGGLALTFDW